MNLQKFTRLICLLLALLLLSAALSACGGNEGELQESTAQQGGEEQPSGDLLTLVKNGVSLCTVIYPSGGAQPKAAEVAFAIASRIRTLYGIEVSVKDDYGSTEDTATDAVEILVGAVKRVEVRELRELVSDQSDVAVAVRGNKLVIVAGGDAGYDRAMSYLKETCLAEGCTSVAVPRSLSYVKLIADNVELQNMASYTIVYAEKANARIKEAAEYLAERLAVYLEKKPDVVSDTAAESKYEILFGETNRKQTTSSVGLNFYDFRIRLNGRKYVVDLGSSFAGILAADGFVEHLVNETLGNRAEGGMDMQALFNPLAFDQSGFVPVWKGTITVPVWMNDFNEKLYAITNPSGRPMAVSHRGDMMNYPENSLEGYLSAALLGTDVIEMDLELTKDHVLVMMHDPTLTRTTNVADMKGKNGLPDSVNVADWTYEQLQSLSLKDPHSGAVTKYKIPSFYEVLLVLKGRCFVALDSKQTGVISAEDILEIELAVDAHEVSMYAMFLSASNGPSQSNSYRYMIDYSKQNPQLTRLGDYAKKLEEYMNMSGHSIRQRGWIDGSANTNPYLESHQKYLAAYEGGLRLIYTNNIPLMSTFIAGYSPDLK